MKVWKDRSGKWIDRKEFMERFKEGVLKVTPLQQTKSTLLSYIPILAGIIWGLVVTFMVNTWWLFTILTGSLFVSGIQFLGIYQKYLILSKLEKEVENAETIIVPQSS